MSIAVDRHPRRRRARLGWQLSVALLATAGLAAGGCQTGRAPGSPSVTIKPAAGEPVRVAVELATTPEARTFGLMYRHELGRNSGMLFVFPRAEPQQFWMHNTQIPLDILYLDDSGKIVRIHERATPMSDAPLPSGTPVRFVLEVAGGFCAEHGVKAGDSVELERLGQTPSS